MEDGTELKQMEMKISTFQPIQRQRFSLDEQTRLALYGVK